VNVDTYVDQANPASSYGTDTFLKSGTPDGTNKTRSLVKFDTSLINGSLILGANANLYETTSYSCQNTEVDILKVTSSFDGSTKWNTQPTYGAKYASRTVAKGYSASCPNDWVSFYDGGANGKTMTDLVQEWAISPATNYGLAVEAANETDVQGWKKFKSTDSGTNVPYLHVTYNPAPDTPSNLSVSTTDPTTPILSGTYSDSDGENGRLFFTVLDGQGTAIYDHVPGVPVASGGSSTLAIPGAGTLADGVTYTWSATAGDASGESSSVQGPSFTYHASMTPPDGVGPVDGPFVVGAGSHQLRGLYVSPSLSNGHLAFQLMDSTCTNVLESGNGGNVNAGVDSVWTPQLSMQVGSSYGLRAKNVPNSGSESQYSSCSTFSVFTNMTLNQPNDASLSTSLTPTTPIC
jgi:hypothetical protein